MTDSVRIAIIVEGGVVQSVLTAGTPVEYVLIDYDIDGADPKELGAVPQDSGPDAKAYLSRDDASGIPGGADSAFVETMFALTSFGEELPPSTKGN